MSKEPMTLLEKAKAVPIKQGAWKSCTREELALALAVTRGEVTMVAAVVAMTEGKTRLNAPVYLYRVLAAAIRQGWLVEVK